MLRPVGRVVVDDGLAVQLAQVQVQVQVARRVQVERQVLVELAGPVVRAHRLDLRRILTMLKRVR